MGCLARLRRGPPAAGEIRDVGSARQREISANRFGRGAGQRCSHREQQAGPGHKIRDRGDNVWTAACHDAPCNESQAFDREKRKDCVNRPPIKERHGDRLQLSPTPRG